MEQFKQLLLNGSFIKVSASDPDYIPTLFWYMDGSVYASNKELGTFKHARSLDDIAVFMQVTTESGLYYADVVF